MPTPANPEPSRLTVAVFCSTVASVLGLIYYAARTGLADNSPTVLIETIGLSLFVVCLSSGVCVLTRSLGFQIGRSSAVFFDATLSMGALAIVALSGWLRPTIGYSFLSVYVIGGFVLGGLTLIAWLRTGRIRPSLMLLVAAALFGIWVGAATWSSGYQNPLYEESIIARNYLCRDMLLPASVANMIKTYGIASFGLDGLTYCYYHWGAYWLFAQVSELFDMNQMRFGQLCYPVIFIPFMISRFLVLIIDIRSLFSGEQQAWDCRYDASFWLFLFLAWVGFLPSESARTMFLGYHNQFISETYCVGLTLAFTLMSLSAWLYGEVATNRTTLSTRGRIVVCMMPFLLCLLGITKISLMFLLLVAYAYLAVRLGLWKDRFVVGALVLTSLLMIVMVKLTVAPHGAGFDFIYPFGFFISNVKWSGKPFFFIFYFFWAWALIVSRCHQQNLTTMGGVWTALRERRLIDIETLVTLCVAGTVPAFLLAIPGGSGHYFSDFQSWFALALLLADSSAVRLPGMFFGRIREAISESIANVRIHDVVGAVVVVSLIVCMLFNAAQCFRQMIGFNLSVRCSLAFPDAAESKLAILQEHFKESLKRLVWRGETTSLKGFVESEIEPLIWGAEKNLQSLPAYNMFQVFGELAALPRDLRKKSAVFIPHDLSLYWDLLPYCDVMPFVVPAFTGMAMIDGLPEADCRFSGWSHHYSPYRLRTHNQSLDEKQEPIVCRKALDKGFSSVFFVGENGVNRVRAARVSCTGQSSQLDKSD